MFEGPCTQCQYKVDCPVYPRLVHDLYRHRAFQRGDVLDHIDARLDELSKLWLHGVAANLGVWPHDEVIISLSALFDFLCSALYARTAVIRDDPRPALRCRDELIFPFTWMCPRCVIRGRPRVECYLPDARREVNNGAVKYYVKPDHLAKPGGRSIGDIGFKVLMSILRTIMGTSLYPLRLKTGGGGGEFDLTMSSADELVFAEVKAKPLVAFPLVLREYFKDSQSADHTWERDYALEGVQPALYVAASDSFIPLGPIGTASWPLDSPSIEQICRDPQQTQRIVRTWKRHLDAYRTWTGEPDELRWQRFGGGNFSIDRVEYRVANTKELPGLDRTDDIKKGTSQVLGFSKFKLNCQRVALKSALLSNLYAETHGTDYVDPIARLQVTIPGASRREWIFDMMLGLSRNIFNDPLLEGIFDTEKIMQRVRDMGAGSP